MLAIRLLEFPHKTVCYRTSTCYDKCRGRREGAATSAP